MKKGYYLTTPMYYPSDRLHIGHALTTVWADAHARFKRLQGYDVVFATGTDEHGQKIAERAAQAGKTPQEFVDDIVAWIKDLWKTLNISYDVFRRTTDTDHEQVVQAVVERLFKQGDIYKDVYEGWYCVPCESYWTEAQLEDGSCPDCGRPVKLVREDAYFLRLSKYQEQLEKHFAENPDFLQPESRRNEMINNFLKPGLNDLCISRSAIEWGVQVPFDDEHVVYVWIDALLTYISGIGYCLDDKRFTRYWPADVHFIGKEIVRFHTIIWPIMLMALGLPLPKKVFAHGWLLFGGDKMSKSKGNVIDPNILVKAYGRDALRYYLLREATRTGSDGNFTVELLRQRINYDLANDLGNLLSRTVAMIEKYRDGLIPEPGVVEDIDDELKAMASALRAAVTSNMDAMDPNGALGSIMELVKRANKYIDETTPWLLARDENQGQRLATVLYNLAETLRIVAVALQPFMPDTAQEMLRQLGCGESKSLRSWDSIAQFGQLPPGTNVQRGKPLFPRLDLSAEPEVLQYLEQEEEPEPEEPTISYEEFSKLDLRVGEVVAAERIPKSSKLLKLKVSLGNTTRQIVAGIAKYYQPEELVGKHVVIVANLQPARIFGVESQGMVLAASDEEGLSLVTPEKIIKAGGQVK